MTADQLLSDLSFRNIRIKTVSVIKTVQVNHVDVFSTVFCGALIFKCLVFCYKQPKKQTILSKKQGVFNMFESLKWIKDETCYSQTCSACC